MIRIINYTICIVLFSCVFVSCQKKEFETIFDRPENLANPIYDQLVARKNFTNLVACIDKAGLKSVIGTSGYWTFFAPNDDAFNAYFRATGKTSVNDVDSTTAANIVSYCLVLNAYRKDQLSSTQTAKGPTPGTAFRRKTYYYDFVYKDPMHSGMVVNTNRNGNTYINNDNNNKYIPYFIDAFTGLSGVSSSDYSAFFPGSVYSGFNVAGARVINADIPAENGIIHEIDKVIEPLPNIEQYVSSNPDYSEFKKLLDRVAIYSYNSALSKRFNTLTGKNDSVFVKSYPPTLALSPNNEGYLAVFQTDGQEQSWTVSIPKNDALLAWEKEILVNYGSFEKAQPSVLIDLINSFLWTTAVWPKDILQTKNYQVQEATFNNANIVDRKVLSNGTFYGTNVAQKANLFRTVYGKAYLDPKYSLMTRVFGESDLKFASSNSAQKYTLFMMSNTGMKDIGYTFNTDQNQWSYVPPSAPTTTPALSLTSEPLGRIGQISLVPTPHGELDDLSGKGVIETFGGEYIKFDNFRIYTANNIAKGTSVAIDSSKEASNGKVYYVKGILEAPENTETLGMSIERLALSTDANVRDKFNYFYQYLIGTTLWASTLKDITDAPVGAFYTALIPTNTAISDAVKDGKLPGNTTTGIPQFDKTKWSAADITKITNMILYHIINKNTIAVDGKKSGLYQTLLSKGGEPRLLNISYPNPANPVPDQMQIREELGGTTTVNLPYSNNLANRALIHSINKVLISN